MTTALLAVLILAAPPPPARADFKVELFSNRTVTAISLSSPSRDVAVCGSSTGEPCWNLPASQKMSCTSDHTVHCRVGTAERNLTALTVDAPIQITPKFAIAREPSPTFLAPNVQITTNRLGLHVATQVDLETYVSGVLDGEASVLQSPAARRAMAIVARTWGAAVAGPPSCCGIRLLLADALPGFPLAIDVRVLIQRRPLIPRLSPPALRDKFCFFTESWRIRTSYRLLRRQD